MLRRAPADYYSAGDHRHLESAKTFEDVGTIAFRVFERIPFDSVGMVCGPITTGGAGLKAKNLERLADTIDQLHSVGVPLFTQLPLEDALFRLSADPCSKGSLHLLETVYRPLFLTGRMRPLFFLPQWYTSEGTKWEHEQARQLGIHRVYLIE